MWNRRKGEFKDEQEESGENMFNSREQELDEIAATIMERMGVSIHEARRMARDSGHFD